ncbi:MAG: DUF1566 domain-containing protein [Paramuribaculum sp.]|nr:DUF1566 domain-containing protein [Paramuribaculum sp.]
MKLNHIFSSMLIAASISLGGCAADDIDSPDSPDVVGEGNVTLTFRSAKNASRADDSSNNEDKINTLMVFLYPDGADDDTAPVAFATFGSLNKNTVTTVKMSLSKADTEKLFPGGNGSECRMVAIANLPVTTSLPEAKTVANLRNILIEGSIVNQQGNLPQESFYMFGDTEEGRTGTVKVKYTENTFGGTAEGTVVLVRAAARISLNIRVPETIEVDENGTKVIWISQATGMEVMLDNGVRQSVVDPSVLTERPADNAYFSIGAGKNFKFTDSGETGENAYRWKQILPFYTYPNRWESSPGETHKTTMTLIVPWKRDGAQTYRTCYYKVPVTGGTELLRNTAYTVNLNVGMLGSFIKEEPLEVTPTYLAIDWADVDAGVDIKEYRYLVVNQNNYFVDNQSAISIPFYSSHEVEVRDITMTYQRFNMYGNNSEIMNIPITMEQNHRTGIENNGDSIFTYNLESDAMGNNVLTIDHPLTTWAPRGENGNVINETGYNNKTQAQNAIDNISYYVPVTGQAQAYSPYVIKVKIKHKGLEDGTAFEQTMTITQYPGMWILGDQNPGTPSNNPSTNAQYGYVYVNGGRDNYGGASGLTGSNKNPNMYVITINTLDTEQQKYIIDDPRYYLPINLNNDRPNNGIPRNYYLPGSTSLNDPIAAPVPGSATAELLSSVGSWSASSPALYRGDDLTPATGQRLLYYYPTNEGADFAKVIAPKIRVASSYGAVGNLSRINARRRCASYQEAGRPAGRWRIPTVSEMEYIVNLSRTGKIPELFSPGDDGYWSAQGIVPIPDRSNTTVTLAATGNNSSTTAVRCVYDEWFWEEFKPASDKSFSSYYTTFTWGDRPKANPEE